MKNFIDHISISNFKSIRNLKLEGLSRINLFIGKPNVGKSNILEAFSLFSLPYIQYTKQKELSYFIRADHGAELFFDGIKENDITIFANDFFCTIEFAKKKRLGLDLGSNSIGWVAQINENDLLIGINAQGIETYIDLNEKLKAKQIKRSHPNEIISPVKSYFFKNNTQQKKSNINFLAPPIGENLFEIIEKIDDLKTQITSIFNEYNLMLVFDRASNELKIMKPPKGKEIFLIPYSSIADTLQRVIFYKTAIASNQNSVLIFEEPEAHAFPPYIIHITREIIESKSNQFMISTHSPYILDYFLENAMDELSIFMVDYKGGETVTNRLLKEDMVDIQRYGIDLFTNYETFLK